ADEGKADMGGVGAPWVHPQLEAKAVTDGLAQASGIPHHHDHARERSDVIARHLGVTAEDLVASWRGHAGPRARLGRGREEPPGKSSEAEHLHAGTIAVIDRPR